MTGLLDRLLDRFDRSYDRISIIDGHTTNLKEVVLSDEEVTERGAFDSLCDNVKKDKNIPIGKQVR